MRFKLLIVAGAVIGVTKALKPLVRLLAQRSGSARHASLAHALLNRSAAFRKRSAYNKEFAKAAAFLCEGTYQGQEETERRMRELGFSDPVSKNYSSDFEMNASPITLASEVVPKGDEKYLVIAAAVRGTHPNDIGDYLTDIRSGLFNMDGFREAGEAGMDAVREYCVSRQMTNGIDVDHTILFVTGHSLGAAIAGQIAGNLENEVAKRENIFAYTFASPNYETRGKKTDVYKNIHNVINIKDVVPHFPLGSKRFGVDHTFKGKARNPFDHHEMPVYLAGIKDGILE